MIFWRTNKANKMFLTKKRKLFFEQSRIAKNQELPGIISKDQEIELQQSKYLQDAQETKETMQKTRKKKH
jgi:hypothetical protein